jgi:hypothetical protein
MNAFLLLFKNKAPNRGGRIDFQVILKEKPLSKRD